ncbi:MAG: RidA family protein [Nevskia sp.]|nr:RidA family protein [Nevskia sp.]
MSIEQRLADLGLVLPQPLQLPAAATLPFAFVRVVGNRALVSGHGPQRPDGSIAAPLGKLGLDLDAQQGYQAARLTALSILASLQRRLGSLDRVACWVRALGMINSAPGFTQQSAVMNGFSELIVSLYGPQRGEHARSAVGMSALPFDFPVEIEAEVLIDI